MANDKIMHAATERVLAANLVKTSLVLLFVMIRSRISAKSKTPAHPSIRLLKVMNMGALAVAATAAVTPWALAAVTRAIAETVTAMQPPKRIASEVVRKI